MSKVGARLGHSSALRKPVRKIIITKGREVRTIVIRPWLTATLASVGVAFFGAYFAATGYLVFRDDLLAASIARQARIQHAYEDRIASLRADIDRLTSRQLLNQQAFEARLEKLLGRQAALDARQDIIAGLSQAARRAGLTAPAHIPVPVPKPVKRAEPVTDKVITTGSVGPLKPGRGAPIAAAALRPSHADSTVGTPDGRMAAVEDSLDELAHEQVAYVERVAGKVGERAGRIASVLKKLGHRVPKAKAVQPTDIGGPFVPLAANVDPETFRGNVQAVTAEIERLAEVKGLASRLPLAKPVTNVAIASGFGTRLDPFLRRPALHTGVDFRAARGYPVRSTAAGTVVTAAYSGGYGKMVEIDHGNGITTRYGHLSRISVKAGDKIERGRLVGRAGSTGRSTGPHLHYEIRIGGNAIDPMRYIRAGSEIGSLL